MKPAAVVLMVSLAAALAACGKSEEDIQRPAGESAAEAPVVQDEATTLPPPVDTVPDSAPSATVAEPPPATPPAPAPSATTPPPSSTVTPAPARPAPASPTTPSTTAPAPTAEAPSAAPAAPAGEAAPPSADLAHGEQIYRKACAFCHDRGTAGAPKLGDAQAWAPRIAQGNEVLYTNSIKGIRAMPPKGGNPTLSEADVKAAVDFLVARSR